MAQFGHVDGIHFIAAKVHIGDKDAHTIQAQLLDQIQIYFRLARIIFRPKLGPRRRLWIVVDPRDLIALTIQAKLVALHTDKAVRHCGLIRPLDAQRRTIATPH